MLIGQLMLKFTDFMYMNINCYIGTYKVPHDLTLNKNNNKTTKKLAFTGRLADVKRLS